MLELGASVHPFPAGRSLAWCKRVVNQYPAPAGEGHEDVVGLIGGRIAIESREASVSRGMIGFVLEQPGIVLQEPHRAVDARDAAGKATPARHGQRPVESDCRQEILLVSITPVTFLRARLSIPALEHVV